MNKDLVIKKCLKCGAIIKVIENCSCDDCGIICCGEEMKIMSANSTDAIVEKHVPTYELENGMLKVKVNHVMDEDHFIEWVCLKTDDREEYIYLHPKEEAATTFKNVSSGILYAYCNKHGLWKAKIGE